MEGLEVSDLKTFQNVVFRHSMVRQRRLVPGRRQMGPSYRHGLEHLDHALGHRLCPIAEGRPDHMLKRIALGVFRKVVGILQPPPFHGPHKVHIVPIAALVFGRGPLDLRQRMGAAPPLDGAVWKPEGVGLPSLRRRFGENVVGGDGAR